MFGVTKSNDTEVKIYDYSLFYFGIMMCVKMNMFFFYKWIDDKI